MTIGWCEKHWKPYQGGRADGMQATVLLMRRLVDSEAFKRFCGWNPETGAEAKGELVQKKMEEVSPICCYLGDDVLNGIFLEAAEPLGRST